MNIFDWTAMLRGDLKLRLRGMEVEAAPFPAELYQKRRRGTVIFISLFHNCYGRRDFSVAAFHFCNFFITPVQPPVSSQHLFPLSLE